MAEEAPDFGNEDKAGVDSTSAIEDGDGNGLRANVLIRGDGKKALATDTTISSVNVPQGRYPFPMSWFRLINTGALNDTIQIDVEGTVSDPSAPDRDTPAYTKTFTVQAGEVGDELAMAARIVTELNADTVFKDTCFLKAVRAKDRAIVVIRSTKPSTVSDFYERPTATAFQITPSGSADVFVKWPDFVSRPLETELDVNPDNPHSLGIFGVTGSFNVQPGSVSNTFEIEIADSGGLTQMAVDGDPTPVVFSLFNSPLYDSSFDYYITSVIIQALDNGVKLNNFLALNSPLTNGIQFDIQSDQLDVVIPTIYSTRLIKRFASIGGWELDIEAGGDDLKSTKDFGLTPIVIRAAGTFTVDDHFDVSVNDDIDQVDDLKIILRGFRREPT